VGAPLADVPRGSCLNRKVVFQESTCWLVKYGCEMKTRWNFILAYQNKNKNNKEQKRHLVH
jgi:hypothetical protein